VSWNVPNWWQFALLALAAFRVWRLLGEDSILARPRASFKRRTSDYWDQFLLCPWCAGFWITLIWWLAWIAWPHWTLIVATPFAINAVVGLIAANLDPD
jgi:hypothetical protein